LGNVAGVGNAGGLRFDERRSAGDFDLRFDRADLKLNIDTAVIAADELDFLDEKLFETGFAGAYGIGAFAQLRDGVDAFGVGRGVGLDTGLFVGGRHADIGDGGAAGINGRAGDGGERGLRGQGYSKREEESCARQ
jgi:hypothetical protein